jgi:hypothetical protein
MAATIMNRLIRNCSRAVIKLRLRIGNIPDGINRDVKKLLPIILIILLATTNSPAQEGQIAKPIPNVREFKTYQEITDKLPLAEALDMLIWLADIGNCDSARYLSSFLKNKGIKDTEGRDHRFWLLYAAKCGDIPSMIEIGFPGKYYATTQIPCGDHKLDILTECTSLNKEMGYPVCKKQIFSFFDNKNKLLKKRTAVYTTPPDDRSIAYTVSCISDKEGKPFYYDIDSTNFGSCYGGGARVCGWHDVFDIKGRYAGYVGVDVSYTYFKVVHKRVPPDIEERIQNNKVDWLLSEINLYPKF